MLADRCKLAAVLLALLGKRRVGRFGFDQQIGDCSAQRRRLAGIRASAQEDPAAFAAAFGQTRIAQDADMTRYAGLALPQHLRHFAHGQFHRPQQAHDPETGRVGQGPEESIGAHCRMDIKIFLYL